jgi:hypothetical protein
MRRLAASLSFHSANNATVMPVGSAGVVYWSSRHRRKLTGPADVGRGDLSAKFLRFASRRTN